MDKKLSIVVSVYNEEANIKPLVDAINAALKGYDYEIIYVDDGSTDRTVEILKSIQDEHLIVVELRKNYGQSLALMAGIDQAEGDFIITMDGDLQNDPQDIPGMVQTAIDGNWDMVGGIRKKRQDGMLLRLIPSKIANWIIRQASGIRLKDYGCAIKVLRKEIAKDLGLYGELHRFVPVLAYLEGARITEVDVQHHPRIAGKSKYGLNRTLKVVSDLVLMIFFKRYMQKPMHLFGNWGIFIFLAGAAVNLYLLYLKFGLGQDIWGKPLLIFGLMLVLGGIQLITIGIVVEIQMRTYFESQQKRPYKVRTVTKN